MQKTENTSITLTESALRRINNVMCANEDLGSRFRVYVTGGGCSGFQYGFKFIRLTMVASPCKADKFKALQC